MTLEIYLDLLKKCADSMECRYLCPIYLVGSFLDRFMEASDIDIIMVADDRRIKRLCGDLVYNDKRFRFNRKNKLYFEEFVTTFDIDFKLYTEREALSRQGKRLRLGKYADPFLPFEESENETSQ